MNAIREAVPGKMKSAYQHQTRPGDATYAGLHRIEDQCGSPGRSALAKRIPATRSLNRFLILIKG